MTTKAHAALPDGNVVALILNIFACRARPRAWANIAPDD
jgi:hypothetical protein